MYPGGLWNLQCATLGDDPAEVDEVKVGDLVSRYNLNWYNAEAHKSTFVLPPIAHRVLERPPPLLSEVTHNLEEVMATEGLQTPSTAGHDWSDDTATAIHKVIAEHKSTPDAPKLAVFDADGTIWRDDITHAFWMYVIKENLTGEEAEQDLYQLKTVLEQWDGTVDAPQSVAGVSQLEARIMTNCRQVSSLFYNFLRTLGPKQDNVVEEFLQTLDPTAYRRESIYWAMAKLKENGWKVNSSCIVKALRQCS